MYHEPPPEPTKEPAACIVGTWRPESSEAYIKDVFSYQGLAPEIRIDDVTGGVTFAFDAKTFTFNYDHLTVYGVIDTEGIPAFDVVVEINGSVSGTYKTQGNQISFVAANPNGVTVTISTLGRSTSLTLASYDALTFSCGADTLKLSRPEFSKAQWVFERAQG
jgi:hypothetical protein